MNVKYKSRIFQLLRKLFLFIYFKLNPIKCSKFMGVQIGTNCKIYGNNPNMWGTEPFLIEIGDNVHITDGCKFLTHDGGTLILRHITPDLEVTAPILIGNNVYLGIETLILPGVVIENNIIVGARSVVTKNLNKDSVYAGIPARFIKSIDDYHEKLKEISLKIGHLSKDNKEDELKRIFNRNK